MKKGAVINQLVSELLAGLGHMDEIVIADAGLPIPPGTRRIDLALTRGIPIPGYLICDFKRDVRRESCRRPGDGIYKSQCV